MEDENFHLEDTENVIRDQVHTIFEANMKKLKRIWLETFGEKICHEHLIKLPDHVQIFFDEVNQESQQRQSAIIDRIKELYEEAKEIKRLMKVNIDVKPLSSVPLYAAQQEMDERLNNLRAQLKERKDQIYEYLLEQESLCEELGEEPQELQTDPLPTEEDLAAFRNHLTTLKDEKYSRCEEISQLRRKTKEILKYLEIPHLCETEDNLLNDRTVSPKMANVRKLRHIHETFAKQYEDMETQINQMRAKLATLWSYLQVDQGEQQKFDKYTQVTQTTYDRLMKELERCECLKRENIQTFVERVRKEIEQWWTKCLKSDEEKLRFTTFKSTVFTEDLLTIHEMELQDLKSFYENNEAIFNKYHERQEMWNRKQQLENTSHDPGRYTNRGGNLLKEEKERKILSKRLPKIEAEISALVAAYNKRHKRPFTVHGRPIEDAIEADWERDRNLKQAVLSARKKKDETPKANNATIRTPRTAGSNLTTTRKMATSTMSVASSKFLHPSSSAKKPANITRSATTLRAGDKRKLPSPPLTMAHAKRSLLKELSNSPAFLKPARPATKLQTSHTIKKVSATTSMRVYNAGTTTKRRTRSGTKARKSTSARRSQRLQVPNMQDTRELMLSSTHSDSVSYEVFEDFLETDPKCRSSIAPNKRRARTNQTGLAVPTITSNHDAGHTPAKMVRTKSCTSISKKSPSASRGASPAPGSSAKKLTTKNLPIMF